MNRHELIEYCLTYPDSYEDYPYDEAWTVMLHRLNKKSFAHKRGGLCVNLKCEPNCADFLRHIYDGITPAYHMNKEHWNTIRLDSDVPIDGLYAMIEYSYRLTMPNRKK